MCARAHYRCSYEWPIRRRRLTWLPACHRSTAGRTGRTGARRPRAGPNKADQETAAELSRPRTERPDWRKNSLNPLSAPVKKLCLVGRKWTVRAPLAPGQRSAGRPRSGADDTLRHLAGQLANSRLIFMPGTAGRLLVVGQLAVMCAQLSRCLAALGRCCFSSPRSLRVGRARAILAA